MKSIYEELKTRRMSYRMNPDSSMLHAVTIIGTILSECQRADPNFKGGEYTVPDEVVIKVLKKMKANAESNISLSNSDLMVEKYHEELEIIAPFIPFQLSDSDIIEIIGSDPAFMAMPAFMAHMKKTFAGLYDGKVAVDLWKSARK